MDRSVAPLEVKPLIKGLRWGLLIAGVFYGASRYSVLHSKEQKRLAELERTRPEREAKLKAEKDRAAREIMKDLEKQLGSRLS